MPSHVSDEQFGDAIVKSVEDGTFPEDGDVISSKLPSSALATLSNLLEQARTDVKTSIRELSRLSAPDIDGWIVQAKQLRTDIEHSQQLASQIVTRANEGGNLESRVQDASAKLDLLNREVGFNGALEEILQRLLELRDTLGEGQGTMLDGDILEVVTLLQNTEHNLETLHVCRKTTIAELIRARIGDLRAECQKAITERWDSTIQLDSTSSKISIHLRTDGQSATEFTSVVTALSKLDLLDSKIALLRKAIDSIIITPRLRKTTDSTVRSLIVDGDDLSLTGRTSDTSTRALLADINVMIQYLTSRLPSSIAVPLSSVLMPSLMSRLEYGPLRSSVPTDLDGVPEFETTLKVILSFADTLDSHKWQGNSALVGWVEQAPKVWLGKRRETSLDAVRTLLLKGLGNPRAVERVETQFVSREDEVFANKKDKDDWNAHWSDEENEMTASSNPRASNVKEGVDEEDVSAWELQDDTEKRNEEDNSDNANGDEDEADPADAWGWGEDDENAKPIEPLVSRPTQASLSKNNNLAAIKQPTEREMTLKETYNITALPEEILEIIVQAVLDAELLAKPSSSTNPVSPAAAGLLEIPGLVLSMYRATAHNSYSLSNNANMFLYNDSLYISEQLRKFSRDHILISSIRNIQGTSEFSLDSDISALELFGKRAYGKEMESQRTILGDLLDGAQGFANCIEHPFAQACDTAVNSTVDRLRDVYGQWKTVLSPSGLLQSTGSLLSTIISKIITDIEDMSDISEPESQRLTSFCNRIVALEDLFLPESISPHGGEEQETLVPLTAVYTPNWLKFQYLANILESSLVDIKFLWTEGELSLEFGAGEVIDLIEALFADSEHRRRAVGEIRRGVGR